MVRKGAFGRPRKEQVVDKCTHATLHSLPPFYSSHSLYSRPVRRIARAIALGQINKRCIRQSPRSSPPASTERTFKDLVRSRVPLVLWPPSSLVSPSYTPDSSVLPRNIRANLTSRTPKALKFVLVSNIALTHHEIKSTAQVEIRIHNLLLNSRTSRPKAVVNVIVLSTNDVEPTNRTTIANVMTYSQSSSEYGRLYMRSQEFRTRVHHGDNFGDD